jgi:hypothetical protein
VDGGQWAVRAEREGTAWGVPSQFVTFRCISAGKGDSPIFVDTKIGTVPVKPAPHDFTRSVKSTFCQVFQGNSPSVWESGQDAGHCLLEVDSPIFVDHGCAAVPAKTGTVPRLPMPLLPPPQHGRVGLPGIGAATMDSSAAFLGRNGFRGTVPFSSTTALPRCPRKLGQSATGGGDCAVRPLSGKMPEPRVGTALPFRILVLSQKGGGPGLPFLVGGDPQPACG